MNRQFSIMLILFIMFSPLTLGWSRPSFAEEPSVIDLVQLNQNIGQDYEAIVSFNDLLTNALNHQLILYGEAHDQEGAARQFLKLLDALRAADARPVRMGVEFIDRGDADILEAYLNGSQDESEFLERLMPTSLLLSPHVGSSHMNLLRYARYHSIEVVPLESRPAGARPRALRNSEIRWNLAQETGRRPESRFLVLYGISHVLGEDPITSGLDLAATVITSYGDSVQMSYRRKRGHFPLVGEVLRLRPNVYLQSVGEPPGSRDLIQFDLQAREELLMTIEAVYSGSRKNLDLLVAALMDDEIRWRRAAIHALRFAAGEDLGYDSQATTSARKTSNRRWRQWLRERKTAVSSWGAR